MKKTGQCMETSDLFFICIKLTMYFYLHKVDKNGKPNFRSVVLWIEEIIKEEL